MYYIFLSSIKLEALSAWSSFASAIVALVALIYAAVALNNWKVQKAFDLKIELLSKMGEALTLLNKLNKTSFSNYELDEGQISILEDIRRRINDERVAQIQAIQSGFYNNWGKIEDDIVKMRQVAMKAIRFNKNVEIKQFFVLFSLYEAEIFNTIYNYTNIHLTNYSEVYNFPEIKFNGTPMPHPRLDELMQRGNSKLYSIELLFNNLKNITEEDEYKRMLFIYQKYYFTDLK